MKKYLIFATLVAMVFVGCKKNTTAPPKKPADNRVATQFSGKILKDDVKTTTRVTTDGNWEGTENVGIYMLPTGSRKSGTAVASNHKFLASKDGDLTPIGQNMYFPAGKTKVDFIAYHPYSTALNKERHVLEVDFSDQSNFSRLEILWAVVPEQNHEKPSVLLIFKRLQSSIKIELVSNTKYISNALVKRAKIKVTNVPTLAKFDIMKGTIEDPSEPLDLLLSSSRLVYLPPHTKEGFKDRKIIVELPYGGKTLRFTTPITFDMVAGKTHLVTLGLGDTTGELAVSSTIEPWWQGKRQDELPQRLK